MGPSPTMTALMAPKSTPDGVIARVNAAARSALQDGATRQKLNAIGFDIPDREQLTPAALRAFQKEEIEKWWPVIKSANIKGE